MDIYLLIKKFLGTQKAALSVSVLSLVIVLLSSVISSDSTNQNQSAVDPAFQVVDEVLQYRASDQEDWVDLFDLAQLTDTSDTEQQVELRVTEDFVEWRAGSEDWNGLLALAELVGPQGQAIELRTTASSIEWRYKSDENWTVLIPLSSLRGAQGPAGPQGIAGPAGDQGLRGVSGQQGPQGPAGQNGLTPTIGQNGNWYIGSTDTGVLASASGLVPYRVVRTAAELQAMSECLSCNYVLMNDIDLTGVTWTPVGTLANPFTGSLDGQNHTIKNFSYSNNAVSNVGLFGVASGVSIQDIYFFDNSNELILDGNNNVGYLVGLIQGGDVMFNNIRFELSDDISGTSGVGLLAGQVSNANVIVSNVIADVDDVRADSEVGILFGMVQSVDYLQLLISDTTIFGSDVITGVGNAGGLVGRIQNMRVIISNLNTEIDIDGVGTNLGGLIGLLESSFVEVKQVTIEAEMDPAELEPVLRNVGGIVGRVFDSTLDVRQFTLGDSNNFIEMYEIIENGGAAIGIVTYSSQVSFENGHVASIVSGDKNIGGLIGAVAYDLPTYEYFTDSRVYVYNVHILTELDEVTTGSNYGGLIGYAHAIDFEGRGIDMVLNRFQLNESYNVGGMFGLVSYQHQSGLQFTNFIQTNDIDLRNSTIRGDITVYNDDNNLTNLNVGGVIGMLNSAQLISSGASLSFNLSDYIFMNDLDIGMYELNANGNRVGGVIGTALGGDVAVRYIQMSSHISSDNQTGGILGFGSGIDLDIRDTIVDGSITAGSPLGGFVAEASGINIILFDDIISRLVFTSSPTTNADIIAVASEDSKLTFSGFKQESDDLTDNS